MRRFEPVRVALGGAFALLIAIGGCSAPSMVAPPTVVATTPPATLIVTATAKPTRDAVQIMTRLRRTASLQGVAEQCAAAIGAPAGVARVRIEAPAGDGCTPCNKLPIGYIDKGVPVSEVAQPLADGAWVWLTVDDMLCIFLYDGQEFKPSSVTRW
jgi:hypothetical protein